MKDDFYEALDFGPCCVCGKEGPGVRNLVLLPKKGPDPLHGWGCAVCGVRGGAVAVICDECVHDQKVQIKFVCDGFPIDKKRIPIEEVRESLIHDIRYHPEMAVEN